MPFPQQEDDADYIVTGTGNKISRRATISSSQHVHLGGKCILSSSTTLHSSEKTPIRLGRYCVLDSGSTLKPPEGKSLRVGNYVHIESDCLIEAVHVGNYIRMGKGVRIGKGAVVRDCVVIEDGTVIPDYAVIPSYSKVQGIPGTVTQMSEGIEMVLETHARKWYCGIVDEL